MLKEYNDPYYSFSTNCPPLKLKKDYIAGLGDSADSTLKDAMVRDERELDLGKLAGASFHFDCLENIHGVSLQR